MAMTKYSALPKTPALEPQYQMQLSILLRMPPFSEVLPNCRGCSQHILSPAVLAKWKSPYIPYFIYMFQRKKQNQPKTFVRPDFVFFEKHANLNSYKNNLYRILAERLECSPVARETWVRSQIESYQRLKKWYLMPPCLTLSIIRYGSRVKWSNPGKGVAPSPTPWCSSYRKGSLRVTLNYGRLLYFTYKNN